MVNLIFYKGSAPHATMWDKLICLVTNSKYSHVEISFENIDESYKCWSSSNRDGGIRTKWIQIDKESWDIFPIVSEINEEWFLQHKSEKYDYIGLLGTLTNTDWFSSSTKWFCSECIAEVLGLKDSWKYSPEDLYKTIK